MIGEERTITIRCIGVNDDGLEIWSIRVGDLPDCQLHFEHGPGDSISLDGGSSKEHGT